MSTYQTDDPCLICREEYLDRCWHHVKTRGSGGSDNAYNKMPLCFACHTLIHQLGTRRAAEKYLQVFRWLERNGWEQCQLTRRWHHYEEGQAA